MNDEILKSNISANIAKYRKNLGLTQYDLAEKLNYSDKAVSKWERGEALPDVIILSKLAELFGITVDSLLMNPNIQVESKKTKLKRTNHLVVSMLSIGLVWLVAIILFVLLDNINLFAEQLWLIFIYAIPVSMIIAIVFSGLWASHRILIYIFVSGLIWSILLAIYLSHPIWNVFLIGIPLQILTILWYFRIKNSMKK